MTEHPELSQAQVFLLQHQHTRRYAALDFAIRLHPNRPAATVLTAATEIEAWLSRPVHGEKV